MREELPPPANGNHSSDNGGFESWHDLVATVVAVRGSPPVQPSSAMLGELEQKLGFGNEQTFKRSWPAILGGIAASLAVMSCWLVWHNSGSREVISLANAPAAGNQTVFPQKVQPQIKRSSPSPKPEHAVSTGQSIAAHNPIAPESAALTKPEPLPGQAENQQFQNTERRTGTPVAASSFSNVEITAAPATRLRPIDQQIDLKSDYYVVGMIAAAMESPVSANPFEASLQPAEWTDWISGYELGQQLPPSEALALSETWNWQDPANRSLAVGGAVGTASAAIDEGIGASMTISPPLSDPVTETSKAAPETEESVIK
jgi:hypothetical protein